LAKKEDVPNKKHFPMHIEETVK